MDAATEIRKLPPSHTRELVRILEFSESWKQLMAIIPKSLEKDDYCCDLLTGNLPKYHSDHFRLIENASNKYRRTCSEILLDEWGTSGRIRPALGHLLHLLKKAELFRAADYIAINLLHQTRPDRPQNGPAAAVTVTFSDDLTNEVEHLMNGISYNTSDLENNTINNNLNGTEQTELVVPQIVITEVTTSRFHVEPVQEESDMIEFSAEQNSEANVPNLSALIGSEVIPNFSNILQSDSDNIPEISDLLHSSEQNGDNIPQLSALMDTASDIPQISALLNKSDSVNIPQVINSDASQASSDSDVPQLSALMLPTLLTENSDRSSANSLDSSRPSCHSPLPNLSLNTQLPHFTYQELEVATNNFDERPHLNSLHMEDSLDEANGRFLGGGAFGSVFLALGLLPKPIAVKRLYLKDGNVVNVDDAITTQFRNEVEVLSQYKHDNLLSICGYSCDGPTYCLMYDYISGGALNCRLEKGKEELQWITRLEIAAGTAEGVAYLHTALSTPLIHRDIKSANILLDCENRPKLGDFGIIKLSPNPTATINTTVIGTSVYMAPETFRSGDVHVKTDTFSFGVVILELLTALPPLHENRDLISHVEDACDDDSIKPLLDKSAGDWLSGELDVAEEMFKIAQKCLEEKKKRPKMDEVRDMLNDLSHSAKNAR